MPLNEVAQLLAPHEGHPEGDAPEANNGGAMRWRGKTHGLGGAKGVPDSVDVVGAQRHGEPTPQRGIGLRVILQC